MKRLLTIQLFLLTSALFAQIPQTELTALTDLYSSTKGNNWNQSWDMNRDLSTWSGVTIVDGHVSEIRMLFNNLEGSLPASLSNLTELKVLELSFNKLSGHLPSSLGKLSKLEVLAVNGNSLEGNIPDSFSDLSALKQLHLSSNQLSGNVPLGINKLDHLVVFNVFQNKLTGDIPIELSRSRNLKEFIIAENNFNSSSEISKVLLGNSAQVNLNDKSNFATGEQVIALELEDQN
jgi:Leucine-rich repeat (LRR) protein